MNLPVGTGPQLAPGAHPAGCGTGTPRPDDRSCPACIAFPQCLFLAGAGPIDCPSAPSPNCQTPDGSISFPGRNSLDQFPNVDEVSKILDGQFHGSMHGAVALADRQSTCNPNSPTATTCYNLDARNPNCSPRDPMFWRLHKALDDVVRAWQDSKAVDVVLVIDRSGSMSDPDSSGSTKFQAALSAVDNFADLLENSRPDGQQNRIGLVSYSDSAAINMPLTVADANLRAPGGPLQNALASLSASGPGGCTGIGAGLQKALEMLCPPGNCQGFSSTGDRKAILLLTDGMENRPPCLSPSGSTPNPFCGTQCFGAPFDFNVMEFTQVVAVGFGNSSSLNGDLLTLIAERQGGIYMQNPNGPTNDLKNFFTKAFGKLTDEFLLVDPEGVMSTTEAASDPVEYNSCFDSKLTFASGWQKPIAAGQLRLMVNAPNGDLVPRNAQRVENSSSSSWEFDRITLPFRGTTGGLWRAQLIRPHRNFVNGFAPDSLADTAAGVTVVRREIQRLCPDGCKTVLYFESKRRGPHSVYEQALKEERAAGLIAAVETTTESNRFSQAINSQTWDLIVYARMSSDGAEPYDQRFANLLCEGQRAIITETRPEGLAILRCAGALRDERKNFDSIQGDAKLFSGSLKIKNPGHPVASYGLRPTSAQSLPEAFAENNQTTSILARAEGGKEVLWHINVLGRGLSKLDVHHRSLNQGTGDELIATVRILPSYLPAGGFDQVDASVEVEYPKTGLGTLVAKDRESKGREVRGEVLDQRTDAMSKFVIPTGKATFPLYDDGTHGDLYPDNAYWTGTLSGLGAIDGAYKLRYIFDFTKNGCTTHREIVHTTNVDVRVDPKSSGFTLVDQTSITGGGTRTVVRFNPADRYGNVLGPGAISTVICKPEKVCRLSKDGIIDHGNGSYTITVDSGPRVAGLQLIVAGATFDIALPCLQCPPLKELKLLSKRNLEHSFTKASIRLNSPAPAGGAEIFLSSSNPAAATVPASVVVPEGKSEAQFEVMMHHAHSGPAPVTISAKYGSANAVDQITVLPVGSTAVRSDEPPAIPVQPHDYHE
ncbi:VWA domain-containing protein [bacterium]|nr:VWA domain-containing protein [bacterium]MCI0601872.1 VWA domain-containing protein [bacterium]